MKVKIIVLVLVFLFLVVGFFHKRYFLLLPTIPIYPNNNIEISRVKEEINDRTQKDIDFFYLTNQSVAYAFKPHVNDSLEFLINKTLEPNKLIIFLKYLFNRARPNQLDKSIIPLDISTAKTPSFPAGHAFQAYYLEKYLSNIYPEKKSLFLSIAKECDDTRVKAGLHYPSDGIFSKHIVNSLY